MSLIPSDLLSRIYQQNPGAANPAYNAIPKPQGMPANLGMGQQMPFVPAPVNAPQPQGKYMRQAMQLSGVPGLLAQQRQQQQQQQPTGYMPRELLQWLQQYGGGNAGVSSPFGGLPINLGMGFTPYR